MAKKLTVKDWLSEHVELPQYIDTFINCGFDEIYFIPEIDGAEYLEEMDIKSKSHQKKILQEIEILRKQFAPTKLLFLGPKASGKSTLFRDIGDYTQLQWIPWRIRLRRKCVNCILTLCEMARFYDENYYKFKNGTLSIYDLENLSLVAKAIQNIWENDIIKKIFICRNMEIYRKYSDQILENAPYIFDNIHKYFDNQYHPKQKPLVRLFEIQLGIQTTSIRHSNFDKNRKTFQLIDVPYDLIKDDPNNFFNNYDGDLFDDIKGIIFLIPMSDFCVFDTITNKNKFVSTMEYCHKILKIERFKSSVFYFKATKCDIFYDNIMNGYSMSNCFNEELHEKYINNNGDNYFKTWDKKKDKMGNLQITTHVIPGFIRKYCMNEDSVMLCNDCISIIDRFIGLLFKFKKGRNDWTLVKDAEEIILNGIINMTYMEHGEMLLYGSMSACNLLDEYVYKDFIQWIENNLG